MDKEQLIEKLVEKLPPTAVRGDHIWFEGDWIYPAMLDKSRLLREVRRLQMQPPRARLQTWSRLHGVPPAGEEETARTKRARARQKREREARKRHYATMPSKNPPGLTAKGERMYEHIKAGYAGDPRAKEIAARTVISRAKGDPTLDLALSGYYGNPVVKEMVGTVEVTVYSDGDEYHWVVVDHETGWTNAGSEDTEAKALRKARRAARGKKRFNPDPPDLDRGVRKFLEFNGMDLRSIGPFSTALSIPDGGYLLGPGKWITYRSDKWNDGRHDYIHEFGKSVKIVDFDGGEGSLVAVPSRFARAQTLVKLGTCLGFSFAQGREVIEAKTRGRKPELYCTPCGRALFVVQDKQKFLTGMWGGKLAVESRGIVG